jgi:hypothetical protein
MPVEGTFKRLPPGINQDKKSPNAPKYSNFMITLNTNTRVKNAGDALINPLYDMAEALFGREEGLREFVEFGRDGGTNLAGKKVFDHDPEIEWSDWTVKEFKSAARVEVGVHPKGSRLHLHVPLKIVHWSWIRLNVPRIKVLANEWLEEHGYPLKIHYVFVKAGRMSPEDYLS